MPNRRILKKKARDYMEAGVTRPLTSKNKSIILKTYNKHIEQWIRLAAQSHRAIARKQGSTYEVNIDKFGKWLPKHFWPFHIKNIDNMFVLCAMGASRLYSEKNIDEVGEHMGW
jgi:hypothetical protein